MQNEIEEILKIPVTHEMGVKTDAEKNSIGHVVKAYTPIVILSIIWGMAFVAIKSLEPVLTPVNLTLLRWFIAGGAFLVLAPYAGRLKQKFDIRDLPRFLVIAFANVVSYNLTINYSENSISAGLAVLLVMLGSVFIALFSWIFQGERHGKWIIFSLILAFTGLSILTFGSQMNSGTNTLPGILEVIGTALSFAVFTILSRPLIQKYGAAPFAIWVGLAGTAMLVPLVSGSFFTQVEALSLQSLAAVLYLSLLSTVAGYMIFYSLVKRGTVTRLAIQLYLVPLVGVIGGMFFLSETISVYTMLGGAALVVAVALSTIRAR